MSLVSAAISTVPLRLVITSEMMSGCSPTLLSRSLSTSSDQWYPMPVRSAPSSALMSAAPFSRVSWDVKSDSRLALCSPNTTIPAENSKAQSMTNHGNSVSHRGIFFNDDIYT